MHRRVRRLRAGWTRLEVLVVLGVIAILASIIIPAMLSAREAARSQECRSRQMNLSAAFHAHMTRDPRSRYCTGAHDFARDGCPDTWSWVGDFVYSGPGDFSQLFCPSSPARHSRTLNDLLGHQFVESGEGGLPLGHINSGKCKAINSLTPGAERTRLVAAFASSGYDTNYAASWYLVRSGAKLRRSSDAKFVTVADLNGFEGSLGTMTRWRLAEPNLSFSTIPFLGCASLSDDKLTEAINLQGSGIGVAGERLAQNFNQGPVYSTGTKLISMPPGTELSNQSYDKSASAVKFTTNGAVREYLQDTRHWYAWHGSGKSRHCNLLMADGSIKSFYDQNGDGYLNPGFSIKPGVTGLGYTDDTIELPVAECCSIPFLQTVHFCYPEY